MVSNSDNISLDSSYYDLSNDVLESLRRAHLSDEDKQGILGAFTIGMPQNARSVLFYGDVSDGFNYQKLKNMDKNLKEVLGEGHRQYRFEQHQNKGIVRIDIIRQCR